MWLLFHLILKPQINNCSKQTQVECEDNPWKFQNSSLFQRLDAFLERSHDMMDLMSTCVQFNKLERIEIGGTKGKVRGGERQQLR